ncbi:hypothetical protein FMUBM48_40470 [Nocardia cyriacigeorgica]|nr:hypothetical protein FMUBM48_40470 [Nocardia cyriacigeorgica]
MRRGGRTGEHRDPVAGKGAEVVEETFAGAEQVRDHRQGHLVEVASEELAQRFMRTSRPSAAAKACRSASFGAASTKWKVVPPAIVTDGRGWLQCAIGSLEL